MTPVRFEGEMRVIGYAYEAALHCVQCTETRFPTLRGNPLAAVVDREGNEVTPIYDIYESDGHCCDDCFTPL